MANSVQGYALSTYNVPTFYPQSFTSTGAGLGVLMSAVGTDRASAMLNVGAVNTFTSLAVKIQWSTDDSTYTDLGVAFTTVTAASNYQIVDFNLPAAATLTAGVPIYIRAYATLVGTSALISCNIIGFRQFAASGSSFQSGPAAGV